MFAHLAGDAFLRFEFDAVPDAVRGWLSPQSIRHNLIRQLQADMGRTSDVVSARSRMDTNPVSGASVTDYNNRVISLDSGRWVMATLSAGRWIVREPFVDVLHRNFRIDTEAELAAVVRVVATDFKAFAPKWVRFFDWGDPCWRLVPAGRAVPEARLRAGLLSTIQQKSKPPRYESVRLEPVTTLDFYEKYARAYAIYHRDHPEMQPYAPTASREALSRFLDTGAQGYEVVIGAQWAGFTMTQAQAGGFVRGYKVLDQVLVPPYRGQGYAVAMQRRMLDGLPPEPDAVVFGDIHPLNAASLRTAAHMGRVDVGGRYFVVV